MGKTSIKRLFFRYVGFMIGWLVAGVVISFIFFQLCLNMNFFQPANYAQKQIPTVLKACTKETNFHPERIPNWYEYTLFDTHGTLIASNMEENAQLVSRKLSPNEEKNGRFQQVYSAYAIPQGKLVLSYRLVADFQSATLRKYLPPGEYVYLTATFFLLIFGLLRLSTSFGRRINRELQKISEIAARIEQLELADITETSSIKELSNVLQALKQMQVSLKEALTSQWQAEHQLKAGLQAMAHDIKTPLTIIGGNVELLNATALGEEQQQYVSYIETHLERLNYYADELTQLAVLERATREPQATSIGDLQNEVVLLAESITQEHDLKLTVHQGEAKGKVMIISEELLRAAQNILLNACEYSPVQGTIRLEFEATSTRWSICICDEGAGFSPAALQKAQEKFYSEDASRSQGKHYGLGLAIASEVCANYQGQLHLSNSVVNGHVKGAKVQLAFPVVSV